MQTSIVVLLALVSVTTAQVWLLPGQDRYKYDFPWQQHNHMGATWNKQIGAGKVFGTLGSNDQGLFGKAGYRGTVFNDARGKMDAQAYGTRVLSPNGDTSHFGGKLDWSNDNAKASLDISKQIHGQTTVEGRGAGVWKVDKNTQVSAGGAVSHTGSGRPDVAVQAEIKHNF